MPISKLFCDTVPCYSSSKTLPSPFCSATQLHFVLSANSTQCVLAWKLSSNFLNFVISVTVCNVVDPPHHYCACQTASITCCLQMPVHDNSVTSHFSQQITLNLQRKLAYLEICSPVACRNLHLNLALTPVLCNLSQKGLTCSPDWELSEFVCSFLPQSKEQLVGLG